MKPIFKQKFLEDIDHILDYTRTNFGAIKADELRTKITKAIVTIPENPTLYPKVFSRHNFRKTSLIPFPFSLFYAYDMENVTYLRILHTSQNATVKKIIQ